MMPPTFRVAFCISDNLIKKIYHKHAQDFFSQDVPKFYLIDKSKLSTALILFLYDVPYRGKIILLQEMNILLDHISSYNLIV